MTNLLNLRIENS